MRQRQQIRGAKAAVSSLETVVEHRGRRTESEIDGLQERVDKLTALTESMWTLLCDVSDLTDEHLLHRLHEIDSEDGQADGKVVRRAKRCASCDSMVNPRATLCQFCGAAAPRRSPFDSI